MVTSVDSYRIQMRGIRFRARHGASDAELDLPQDFVVDLELELDAAALPATDERAAVYDYDQLATMVVEEGTRESCRLLETLASRLLARLLDEPHARRAKVRVQKFGPPTTASVDAVAIEVCGSPPSS